VKSVRWRISWQAYPLMLITTPNSAGYRSRNRSACDRLLFGGYGLVYLGAKCCGQIVEMAAQPSDFVVTRAMISAGVGTGSALRCHPKNWVTA
jgi:hypothetical protein